MTHLSIEPGSLQLYTIHTTTTATTATTATTCYYLCYKNCSIYNQCVWAAVLQEFWLKFRQELSTPWHSKRRRRRTTELRTILKNLRVPQGWALHIEQVWRQLVEKPRSYVRAEKSADRRTDRQHFVFI